MTIDQFIDEFESYHDSEFLCYEKIKSLRGNCRYLHALDLIANVTGTRPIIIITDDMIMVNITIVNYSKISSETMIELTRCGVTVVNRSFYLI